MENIEIDELYGKLYKLKKNADIHPLSHLELKQRLMKGDEESIAYVKKMINDIEEAKRAELEEIDILIRYEDTAIYGPGLEMAIDRLIEETTADIKEQIPEKDWREMTREIKKLWIEKIERWSYSNQNWKF